MPACKCGCGQETKGTWVRGHHARVNNPSKRDDVKAKRSEAFHRLHAEGKLGKAWNKGLTKETDERVAVQGRSNSEGWTPERRRQNAETMRKNRLDGTVPTLKGPDHPQWRGGTSKITNRIRGSTRLYELWKRPILVRDGFRCRSCGAGSEASLVVHHDGERFAAILHARMPEVAMERELTWEESSAVLDAVVAYHVSASVSGVTLCERCHDEIHREDPDLDNG